MYLKHLHTDRHFSKLGSSDFQTIRKAEERMDTSETSELNPLKPSSSTSSVISSMSSQSVDCDKEKFLGTEFFYPLISFYCDLCSKFLPTNKQGQIHLRSEKHLLLYQKYTKKNVDYYNKFNDKRMEEFKRSPYVRQYIHEQYRQRLLGQKNKDKSSDSEKKDDSDKPKTVSNQKVTTEIKQLLNSLLDRVVMDCKKNKETSVKPVIEVKKTSETKMQNAEKVVGNKRPAEEDETLNENIQVKKIKEEISKTNDTSATTTITNNNNNDTPTSKLSEVKNKCVPKTKQNNVGKVQTGISNIKKTQTKNESKEPVAVEIAKNDDNDSNTTEKPLETGNVDQPPCSLTGYTRRRAAAAAAASIIAQQSQQTRSKPVKKLPAAKTKSPNNSFIIQYLYIL
ncbi:hypothetical protein BLA29_004138 [Euroglyphus maynei]|uniref:C2H2-type domain-containing protein n=1 Tax=Euroglyphus maynei TaxID=6958 RepID=A0A1Y3AY13_EURMA|nr:hypothetical protein BLA29_004138 [Euroglyphus maynei]